MAVPVKPYEGTEPYIFISYSHRDSDRVFPILRHLSDEGFRLWYDEGIDPGTEWPESIATHLANSKACIAFISENSLASQNCRREINFALSRNHIGFLSVMLEDAQMTPGVELQLSTYQSLLMYKYADIKSFYERLDRVDLLLPCKAVPKAAEPIAAAVPPVSASANTAPAYTEAPAATVPAAAPAASAAVSPAPAAVSAAADTSVKASDSKSKPNKKIFLLAGIGAAVLALAVILIVVLVNKPAADPDTATNTTTTAPEERASRPTAEPTEAVTEEPTEPPVLELSDDPYDFTFQLDGVVYKLPFDFPKLTENGWTISSTGTSDQTEVEAGKKEYFKIVKNGQSLYVTVFNPEEEPRTIQNCQVTEIEVQQSNLSIEDIFCVAKGISANSSVDEIYEAYGPIAELYVGTDYTKLTYGEDTNHCTAFQLYEENQKYNQITLANYPVKAFTPASELSDDLMDFTFSLENELYQLPFAFSTLTEKGWTITSSGYSDRTLVGGQDSESVLLVKNGSRIMVQVVNTSGNARPIAECLIGGIEVDRSDLQDPDSFMIAQMVTLDITKKDLVKAFGEAQENQYSGYTVLTYSDGYTSQTRFTIYDKTPEKNSVRLTNVYEGLLERTETILEAPEYLKAYQAPSQLGDELLSGVAEIGGDLYQLPAPVQAFLDNGWSVRRKPGYVVSRGSEALTLERDGLVLDVSISNLADVQTIPENCVVHNVRINSESGISYKLPKGLELGASKSLLDGLGVKFSTSDLTNYTSYSTYDSVSSLSVNVGKDSGKVDSITLRKTEWTY